MYESLEFILPILIKTLKQSFHSLVFESNNKSYDGCCFFLGSRTYSYRVAKVTPIKKGYFVATWFKDEKNINNEFCLKDYQNFLIV